MGQQAEPWMVWSFWEEEGGSKRWISGLVQAGVGRSRTRWREERRYSNVHQGPFIEKILRRTGHEFNIAMPYARAQKSSHGSQS